MDSNIEVTIGKKHVMFFVSIRTSPGNLPIGSLLKGKPKRAKK
jgi:hypothetical protein